MAKEYTVHILPADICLAAAEGQRLYEALAGAGIEMDAPCGGHGSCGKCRVLINGAAALACAAVVDRDMTVELPARGETDVLTRGLGAPVVPDGTDRYVIAFDIGTTTVAAYLLDGHSGAELAVASAPNPQRVYGADVITRIQYVRRERSSKLRELVADTLGALTRRAAAQVGIAPEEITLACAVGNACMHHLFLGIDPAPLVAPPYMPAVREALELPVGTLLPLAPQAVLRVLPNIAGFVGADTVGCLSATAFDRRPGWALLVDIGTNGEMVLGRGGERVACSAAAGPAFEGAKIDCGQCAAPGAIDHVRWVSGKLLCSVIGGGEARGLCGSGLLDAVAALRQAGRIDESGRMTAGEGRILLRDGVYLSQRDVREVQLAKAAIRAGIELMAGSMGIRAEEIDAVLLAGAFGSRLSPESACAVGLLPPALLPRIVPIGNAAGAGAKRCALSRAAFARSRELAEGTRFLELAALPEFQDCFIEQMSF